ncbi:hypothetical protein H113_00263 [Trichophyton rubrum MR1459]|uniref:Uncharacterized protein n=2 Tax=Trichophyton TaxID=5550 RepID=A0A022WHF0_TRIRU|nr:hypothetical protein H103_00260 [Trichophyton rubrum CBS 288.86]EZF68148.1 hypothetical protein H104_00260 [Trichophyton rubrum CBS 289.86]EZF78807.1 hypothetical protein H105_00253 [Trichophyton soudanense CBS 452.61]EZG00226.1 hypothetical protein H113_00263 [Trichophyton rubrum MR1459]EZG11126.1 hypothetical protein H106_00152 [Trichophyton rubrum CBS 735.88]
MHPGRCGNRLRPTIYYCDSTKSTPGLDSTTAPAGKADDNMILKVLMNVTKGAHIARY